MKHLAFLLIICITGAQASMTASQLEATEVTQIGNGNFFWLQHHEENPALNITFSADRLLFETRTLTLHEVESSGGVGPAPIPTVQAPTGGLEPVKTSGTYREVTGKLSFAQVNAMLTLFSDELAAIDLALSTSTIYGLDDATFDADNGISNLGNQGESDKFRVRQFGESLVISESQEGAISLSMTGDLVIEVEFMDFELETSDGPVLMQSTHERTAVVPSTPGGPAVNEVTDRFVRMTLQGGEIQISDPYFAGTFQGATAETQLYTSNPIHLEDATGQLGSLIFNGETATISAETLQLQPTENGLALDQPEKENQWLGTMATSASLHFAWLLAPLVLLPFLRRRSTLGHMEGAIEAGKFQQASRVAKKLLRKSPYEERATMGYVVAQAKLGEHSTVVAHLQRWLKTKTPSDGVFNYVLGMSFMELGKDQVAREEFAKAIKLTPSLQGEIPSGPVVAEHAYA